VRSVSFHPFPKHTTPRHIGATSPLFTS
jgi:hypothetical protein